jgi:homoserine O-succinyltransferase
MIGLVNNMPVAAKRATEQQFEGLLATASQGMNLRIGFFVVENYAMHTNDAFDLFREFRPDALIVTGDEPQRTVMTDEPLWPALARLVDWAADNTISSVWSCFAAHAAVFRLDHISRKRLPQKLSGMYQCMPATEHPLLSEFPDQWLVPHSRHNNVDETELRDKGYTVLSHAPRLGADTFVKQARDSLFLFLQGHPEYAPDSLFREYRRDVRRFLAGERDAYPEMPENYFDHKTARKLEKLREQAYRAPSPRLLASVYAAFVRATMQTGNATAARLYRNWLSYLVKEKAARAAATQWSVERQRGAA